MKRYRILAFDFDARVHMLTLEVREEWEDEIKRQHLQAKVQMEQSLVNEFGPQAHEIKKQNFIELGDKPISIMAFHNRFFEQIRTAFVMGAYYAALTAACALGERILNHLILILRDDYRNTDQ
jgi:hypothetical protein